MHEETLNDLAMIAACHNRLFSRARSAGEKCVADAVLGISCDAMTELCAALGADGQVVMEKAAAILDAARLAQTSVAH